MRKTVVLSCCLASAVKSAEIAKRLGYATESIQDEVEQLLSDHPILDGHNDLPYVIRDCLSNTIYDERYDFKRDLSLDTVSDENKAWFQGCSAMKWPDADTDFVATDYQRAKKGHLGAQLWSIYVDCDTQYMDAIRQTVEQADLVKRLSEDNSDIMTFCGTADCVRQAWKENKFASLMGMEGGHSIDSSMAMIRVYHELGVRYMTLTHFCNTPWADYSEQTDYDTPRLADYIGGLTDFGKKVVLEMQRVGMMVDISHVSFETMHDVLDIAEAPVIFSHSNARAVWDHSRNAPDDVLLKLKDNGGVIMVNFVPFFLEANGGRDTSYTVVADHLDHIKNLIGPDHIGIGADFDGVTYAANGLEDVSKYPTLFVKLRTRGWSIEDLGKLASDNILRVLEETEAYANGRKMNNPIDFEEAWLSKQDIDRISTEEVLPASKFRADCMTDYSLHPDTDADNFYPVEDTFNLQTLKKIPSSKYEAVNNGAAAAAQGVVMVDGHDDLPWQLRKNKRNAIRDIDLRGNMRDYTEEQQRDMYWVPNHTDWARAKIGGLTAAFWVAYVSCASNYKDAARHTFEQIDVIHRMVDMYPDELAFCRTADQVQAAVDQGKIASMIGIEGGHSMDSSLEILRAYADLGVRYMTMTHNCNIPWADQNDQDNTQSDDFIGGMTEFGQHTVLEMNRLGIFIDISHVSADVMRDSLKWSLAPVIFSHSNVRSVKWHSRNAPDDVLDMLKNNGGVIMVVSLPSYVGDAKTIGHDESGSITDQSVKELADHIDFIKNRIGHEHIGIGADFDGMGSVLNDLRDVSQYPNLWKELANRGYTEDQILDIKGRNLLRAMRGLEKTKKDLAGTQPDETWIYRQDLEAKDERHQCRNDLHLNPDPAKDSSFKVISSILLVAFMMIGR